MQLSKLLKISVALNLGLFGGLVLILSHRQNQPTSSAPPASRTVRLEPGAAAPAASKSSERNRTFRWSDLESTNDYRQFVANLRAIGCPESTIYDIVRGDTRRAFAWERRQLGLNGSGRGPWSRSRETSLVASLLGERPTDVPETGRSTPIAETASRLQNQNSSTATLAGSQTVQDQSADSRGDSMSDTGASPQAARTQPADSAVTSYPLFLQNMNWRALGMTPSQQQVVAQVRQRFIKDIGGLNQNPNDSAYLLRWKQALKKANDSLRGSLGPRAFMAYQQQQYYEWYQPQVLAAQTEGRHLVLNPDAFSISQ